MTDQATLLEQVEIRLTELFGRSDFDKANAVGWSLGDGMSVAVARKGSRDVGDGDQVVYVWLPAEVGPEWIAHQRYAAGEGRANTVEELPGLDRTSAADRFLISAKHELDDLASHLMRQFPLRIRAWRIERRGQAWGAREAIPRFYLAPRKIEMCDGKLFWSDEQRLTVLALLLENVGVDKAMRLGDPAVWKAAAAALE